ncbi:GGDEF domain-containing protein [Demequina sp.]|uniref:GGDEF domain-containing protein n=1 Tax=Demequina sp. TaxID=2050685 RepID=UPI003D150148
MFDIETLRLMLAVVSLAVLALFFLGVYRPTHSPFSGWWTLALVCAASSAVFLLGNGTPTQVYLNPASTGVSAMGAVCVWFATRSLRKRANRVWVLVVIPASCVGVALLDSPSSNEWAGNGVLFAVMAAGFTAGAYEVWGAWAQRRGEPDAAESGEAITALAVSGIAASVLSLLYLSRFVLYMVLGKDDPVFTGVVGSATTSIVLLICLVAVTFSVSAIGWDQRTRALRRRATEDDLTGLLGRSSFLARAQDAISSAGGRRARQAWLVIADLDNFKPINDEFGHQAGDRSLQAFAEVARGALRATDAIGRLGGDEFGIVLENVGEDAVRARLDEIRRRLALEPDAAGHELPTVSFGVAECNDQLTLSEVLGRADAALYDAKAAGRDRVAVYSEAPGVR